MKKSKVENFSVGDRIHVIQLNKASSKFKMMYEGTYGEVIKILSPSEVEEMTYCIKEIGLLVKLEPNRIDNMSTRFGGFGPFRKGEFILTKHDVFIGF
jgi:hypothetical protein